MGNIGEINKLRTSNAEPVKQIKKTFMGGYSRKDVDSIISMTLAEKNKVIKGYEDEISELKTSLSMVVRERDNSVSEKNELLLKNNELVEQNKQLIKINEDLSIKIEKLTESLEEAKNVEIPIVEVNQNVDNVDQVRLELEVENEQLFKNNAELSLKIERLNEKIIEITQQLTNERSESKQEILRLQGELHKKDIAFKLKTNNILENLNVIIKEVESINTY